MGSTCYRRLRFQSEGSQVRMQNVLYLSPDQRYLIRDIMDTTVDVAAQAKAEQTHLEEELAQGKFPSKGNQAALVTITIFSDFQCRFCKQEAAVLSSLDVPGHANVRLVFRHLPLPMHPWARKAAEIAACVYQQNNEAFWDLHDTLFNRQDSIDIDNVERVGEAIVSGRADVNVSEYEQCIAGHKSSDQVERDLAFARAHDIHSTPTIFVNAVRNDGTMTREEIQTLIKLVRSSQNTMIEHP